MNTLYKLSFLAALCLAMSGCRDSHETTALYDRYAADTSVKASCLIGYRIDGSHSADVTLLQAHDSASFARLMADMGMTFASLPYGKMILFNTRVNSGGDTIAEVMGASLKEKSVYVFHCDKGSERYVVNYLKESMNNSSVLHK